MLMIFWVAMLCGLVDRYHRFVGTPEAGSNIIFQNSVIYLQVHMMLLPGRTTLTFLCALTFLTQKYHTS
jgi:hypothetical protein